MSQKSIVLIISLFILIVVGMFVFANLKKAELEHPSVDTSPSKTESAIVPYSDINRIEAKHYFIDNVHTFVGEVHMPTPCDLIDTSVLIAQSYPEQVTLNFDVINNSDTCAQIVTAQRFKVEAIVSEDATFTALFMGRVVNLNLTPALEGEVPEDFELFIKG